MLFYFVYCFINGVFTIEMIEKLGLPAPVRFERGYWVGPPDVALPPAGIRFIVVDVTNGGDHVQDTFEPLPAGVKLLPVQLRRGKDDRPQKGDPAADPLSRCNYLSWMLIPRATSA